VQLLDISRQALAVGQILGRLTQGLSAELVAIGSAEARLENRRRAVWNALVWALTLVGIPVAIAVGLAGRKGGYTDEDDVTVYVVAGVAALVLVVAYAVIASTVRRRTRRHPD
jgi:cation transporter-like permease